MEGNGNAFLNNKEGEDGQIRMGRGQ